MSSETSLGLHRLTSSSDDLSEMLPAVIELSNSIFSADPGSKYASLAIWQQRLSLPSSAVLYLSPSSQPKRPVAFLFAHPRAHDLSLTQGEPESLHVWLAGVLPEHRKEGCLSRLMSALDHVSVLTVCTVPVHYPDMWQWLIKRGWSVEREMGGGKVMLSRRG